MRTSSVNGIHTNVQPAPATGRAAATTAAATAAASAPKTPSSVTGKPIPVRIAPAKVENADTTNAKPCAANASRASTAHGRDCARPRHLVRAHPEKPIYLNLVLVLDLVLVRKQPGLLGPGPGGPGRLPSQGSHRPQRAEFPHWVPQAMVSLRPELQLYLATVYRVHHSRRRQGITQFEPIKLFPRHPSVRPTSQPFVPDTPDLLS